MTTHHAAHLRHRARALQDLASAIEGTPLMTLGTLAGPATWVGGRPDLCERLLATSQHQLHDAADTLRWRAYLLERRADEVQLAAQLAIDC